MKPAPGAAWDDTVAYWKNPGHRRRRHLRPRGRARRRRDLPARLLGHQPRAGGAHLPTGCRTRPPSPTPWSATPPSGPWSTWASPPARPSRTWRWTPCSSGSCTNGHIEDLRAVAAVAEGRRVSSGMRTLVVPGSWAVKAQAEAEGIDRVLTAAGFDWRDPGCSMCPGHGQQLAPGERDASTSNRSFEGRQGKGGRTHLVSPASGRRHRSSPATSPPPTTSDRPDAQGTLTHGTAVRIVSGTRRAGSTAPTSTPTRSSRPTGSSRWSAPASRGPVLRVATTATSCSTRSSTSAPRSPHRRPQLRHQLVASTPGVGHHPVQLPGEWCRPASATSSATTPPPERPDPGRE